VCGGVLGVVRCPLVIQRDSVTRCHQYARPEMDSEAVTYPRGGEGQQLTRWSVIEGW
jgi:hypothetical protein